jgi:DNA repair protein RecO
MASRSASFESVILRAKEVPSGARVVTLLSADQGIVDAFVFGGGKSKLRSLASPWHRGTAWIYRDTAKDLIKLIDFDAITEYSAIRSNLGTIGAASFASEFIVATSALGGDWADALELTTALLSAIDAAADARRVDTVDKSVSLFCVRALALMGLMPDPDECGTCAGAMGRDTLHCYSRRSGGFVCATCARSDPDAFDVPAGALAWLDAVSRLPFGRAVGIGLGSESLLALKTCVLDLAKRAVDAPLRTLKSGLL